jgi:predicted PurR-regulated permease PerM
MGALAPTPSAPAGTAARLRAAGAVAWSAVGLILLVAAGVLALMVLRPIVLAVLIAVFLAIVFTPLVELMARHGVPRAAGAAVGVLIVVAVAIGATVLVIGGVVSQHEAISQNLHTAGTKLQDMLSSAGFGPSAAGSAGSSLRGSAASIASGVLPALGNLLGTLTTLVVALFVTLFTCFFLLKDGPAYAARVRRFVPLAPDRAALVVDQAATTIRGYFVGLTVLGAVNAAAVVVGALILHVPLVGAIAVITFLGSYVPYIGALVAGAFAVLIALGSGGTPAALWMILVVFIANSVLQNMISPFTYGAALDVSPLALLLAAVVGGTLAGIAGVTLSAPLTAITVHTMRLLRSPAAADPVGGATAAPVRPDGVPM